MQLDDVTYRLSGFTFVREFALEVDPRTGAYELKLVLCQSPHASAPSLEVSFEKVSELAMTGFGGGWTQLLVLAVEDVSAQQLDRVRFRVRELESDTLSFACAVIHVSEVRH